jgi:hypothetical protein
MTKRLYFTDPLDAARAMRDFGVKLSYFNPSKEPIEIYNYRRILSLRERVLRYYVHPESEHIFDPKDGDKFGKGRSTFHIEEDEKVYDDDFDCSLELAGEFIKEFNYKIIQRDGKYFPWPEREEVC